MKSGSHGTRAGGANPADFPKLPILHIDDLVRRERLAHLPADIPTIYKPFSIAALTGTVRKLLVRD